MRFKISDEGLNSHGTRVITSGIDLSRAMQNCPIYFNHEDFSWKDYSSIMPSGQMQNFTIEGTELYADSLIDDTTELDQNLKRKVENGIIKTASIGIRVIETSDDPDLLVLGQTRPTITKSELLEVSLVDIPSNANATAQFSAPKFYDQPPVQEGDVLRFNAPLVLTEIENVLPKLNRMGLDEKFNKMFEKLDLLISKKDKTEFDAKDIQEQANNMQAIVDSQTLELTQAKEDLKASEDSKVELQNSVNDLESKNKELAEENKKVNNSIIELKAENLELSTQIENFKKAESENNLEKENNELKLKNFELELKALEDKYNEQQAKLGLAINEKKEVKNFKSVRDFVKNSKNNKNE